MSENEYRPDQLMNHEYDGIREYDNRLPNWWLYTLYGAIVFSIGYWLVFHTFGTVPLPRERYEETMAQAVEAQLKKMEGQELSDASFELFVTLPERVEAGKAIFTQFCVVCHLDQGQGSVGPNLTDAYWLHGDRPLDMLKTVTEGVPEKGMISWEPLLGPAKVQDVVTYLLTLKGTNIPGKAPEGDLIEP